MTGAWVAAAVLLTATVLGLWRRRRDGRLREGEDDVLDGERLTAAELGADLGARATLVQFSTAFCAPCRATRRILGEVAAMVDGVVHIEIDATTRLDLARRAGVVRTPTVLVLDAAGRVVRRAAGAPREPDVIAALGEVIDHAPGGP